MEGRTIARPNENIRLRPAPRSPRLQWRAGQLPGQTGTHHRDGRHAMTLQWRAGQLPGQTCKSLRRSRTRSAWLQWRAGQLPGQTLGRGELPAVARSFNGGPDNCPAKRDGRPGRDEPRGASMEGRTIARPNPGVGDFSTLVQPLQWRAGQLPGQTRLRWATVNSCSELQWRAGQLPGQTGPPAGAGRSGWPGFNGGPDNCPAKPGFLNPARQR